MSTELEFSREDEIAAPAMRTVIVPSDPFARVRLRWLPLWMIGGTLLVLVPVMLVYRLAFGKPDPVASNVLFTYAFYGVLVLWLLRVRQYAGVRFSRLFNTRSARPGAFRGTLLAVPLLLFILGAILLTVFALSLLPSEFLRAWTKAIEDQEIANAAGTVGTILFVLGLAVVAPIVEEIIFRGIILHRLTAKWGVHAGIIVTSIIFCLMHFDPLGKVMFSAVLCVLYIRTRSLWPPIVIHIVINSFACVMMLAQRGAEASPGMAGMPPSRIAGLFIGAMVLMAMSAPFLIIYLARGWPRRGAPLPYQQP